MTHADMPYDHEVVVQVCPVCGDRIEHAANMMGLEPPEPGDMAVCIMCLSVNVFGEDGKIRLPTGGEAMRIAAAPEIQEVLLAMREMGPPPRASE